MPPSQPALHVDQRIFFRDQLRDARAEALRNSEDFHSLLFAIERLGSFLSNGNGTGLGNYKERVREFAERSPLTLTPESAGNFSIPFETLYTLVNRARNDALHQGAYARNLTTHAVELAIMPLVSGKPTERPG